jgi:hypothetical protein
MLYTGEAGDAERADAVRPHWWGVLAGPDKGNRSYYSLLCTAAKGATRC